MDETCPSCGTAVVAGAERCPACGESIERAVVRECSHCGQEVEAAPREACPACGHLEVAARCERHPDREAHGRCVVCGSAVCEECDHEKIVHHLCPRHHEVELIEGWAQVYTTSTDVEAELIRENLRSEGIDAEVLSQKDHMVRVDMGDLSPVRVLVPAYAYEHARSVVEEHMDEHGELAFACPTCGEAYEPGADRCETCGEPLPAATEPERRES